MTLETEKNDGHLLTQIEDEGAHNFGGVVGRRERPWEVFSVLRSAVKCGTLTYITSALMMSSEGLSKK